jgi:hypothetical protein
MFSHIMGMAEVLAIARIEVQNPEALRWISTKNCDLWKEYPYRASR